MSSQSNTSIANRCCLSTYPAEEPAAIVVRENIAAGSAARFHWWASQRPPDRAGSRWKEESISSSRPSEETGEVEEVVRSRMPVGRTGSRRERKPFRRCCLLDL
jgi:hypothetical protein